MGVVLWVEVRGCAEETRGGYWEGWGVRRRAVTCARLTALSLCGGASWQEGTEALSSPTGTLLRGPAFERFLQGLRPHTLECTYTHT